MYYTTQACKGEEPTVHASSLSPTQYKGTPTIIFFLKKSTPLTVCHFLCLPQATHCAQVHNPIRVAGIS